MSITNLKKYKYMLIYGRKLKKYLQDRDIRQKDFAVEMNVSPVTVNNTWIRKSKKPKLFNAYRIHDYTNGIISLGDMGYE
jgi:transcriptional regulator with XRE-family HTH domain